MLVIRQQIMIGHLPYIKKIQVGDLKVDASFTRISYNLRKGTAHPILCQLRYYSIQIAEKGGNLVTGRHQIWYILGFSGPFLAKTTFK